MTGAADKYFELDKKLFVLREKSGFSGDEENRILDEMDVFWWVMTEDEQAVAYSRLSEWTQCREGQ